MKAEGGPKAAQLFIISGYGQRGRGVQSSS